MTKYKVAVVGATGAVGREILKTLAEREFPVAEVFALASAKSAGGEVSYGEDEVLPVRDLATFDFRGVDLCLSSAGAKISAEFAPIAAKAGCVVIDNTSHFRMDPDVPLVVPEVNPQALAGYAKKNIIANPNCSTIQMLVALKPLHDLATIKRIVVATYQSVSGAGREGMDELFNQTRGVFVNDVMVKEQFKKQIAFNVIPHIDDFMEDGMTKEEWKMIVETKKILDPKIKVTATCVRVPVFVGHAEAVNVEFEREIDATMARTAPETRARRHADGLSYRRRLRHPGRMRRRGRGFRIPHPRGFNGRERPQPLDRCRQPAQGRGPERRADRRGFSDGLFKVMRPTIRPFRVSDHAVWLTFWHDYMHGKFWEDSQLSWQRLQGPDAPFKGIIAELAGQPVGFALYGVQASSKRTLPDCYLSDIYVVPGARRRHVGKSLIEWLCHQAASEHWGRLYWHTAVHNTGAQSLYDQIAGRTDKIRYEIDFSKNA